VANDERNGDDLFEDLDKFFAPIKDVEWDEPEPGEASTPQEEHVAVRPSEPAPPPAEPPEAEPAPVLEPEPPPARAEVPDEDDEAWYDTGVLETVASLDADDDDGDEHVRVTGAAAPAGAEPVVIADEDEVRVSRDQQDLFAGAPDEAEGRAGEEPAGETPSESDLEAAAEHFAGSIRSEGTYDTAPLEAGAGDVFEREEPEPVEGTAAAPETGADLLTELGADDVEDEILSDLEPGPSSPVVVGAGQGLGGPSWQEPAAVEVGADLERRGPDVGERDVPAAFLTGVVLAGVALASLLVGETAFAVVAALAALAAQAELFAVMSAHHLQPATFVGLVTGQLLLWGVYFRGEAAIPAMFAIGLVATFLWFMTVPAAHRKQILQNVGVTVLNVAWIPLLASYLVATLDLPDGRELVIAVIGLTFVFDTAAFFVGSVWGGSFFQRPLAASISPKKSLEGLIGGTLVVVVISVAMVPTGFIERLDGARVEALLLGLVVAVAATLGDLAESLVKRDLRVKDMGSILPGHGGVLDRIDSLLFVAPAAYLLFRVVFVP